MLSNLTSEDVRVVNYVLTAIAVTLTCFRLWDRTRTGRLWWDDTSAGATMILLVVFMAAVEVHLQDPTRVSILLTVIRLSLGKLRTILKRTGVGFFLTWVFLFAQIWWVCEGSPKWKQSLTPQCPLGTGVAVAQVITDVLSDAILVFAPLRLVWHTKLSKPQKIRVTAIFSTTLISTAVSLNHAFFVLRRGGLQEALAAVLQCCVSLVVANLSVIIAFFFRITTEEDVQVALPISTHSPGTTTKYSLSGQTQPTTPLTSLYISTGGSVHDRPRVYES
ncbi:hypothetical protein GALMADRAFT_100630 [Galerina marginata CBS 339.88]|uniref:Rhodopsin domain-containing protein n=1 Tax=Galerina marginata (strain CBS 339.88) TaxID=685588 RepID=A0A067T420_GALM3|nr:hypothetical protein GALMADRAFT_100630 [Galerina marginata CBS 339.88]